MSNDFSLVGNESISIAEYLPILENIRHDLKCIYEKIEPIFTMLGTMNLQTMSNSSNMKANMKETLLVNNASVNTEISQTDSFSQTNSDAVKSLYQESEIQISEKLEQVVLLIPEQFKTDEKPFDRLCLYIKSLKHPNDVDNSIDEDDDSQTFSLRDKLTQLKNNVRDHEAKIHDQSDALEQQKEELLTKDGKIENLNKHIKTQAEELAVKDKKIETLKEDILSKDDNIRNLEENINKLQNEKTPFKQEEIKKPKMKKMLEDKIKRIAELESKITKIESKTSDNGEKDQIIAELENKIKHIEIQNDDFIDNNYQQLLSNLKAKRAESRDRESTIQVMENEIADNESKIRRLERELRTLNKKMDELKQEALENEKMKEDLESKYKSILKEVKNVKQAAQNDEEREKSEKELKKLQSSLKDKAVEIQEKDKKINEFQKQTKVISDLQDKLKEKDKFCVDSNTKLQDMEEKIKNLTSELDKKTLAIATMRDKIKVKNEEKTDPLEVKKLQNQLRGKDMELDQTHAKIDNLNEAFQTKCTELDLADRERNKLKSDIENIKRLNFQANKMANAPDVDTKPARTEANPFPAWWKQHMK